jgi:hypothetical protein
MKTTPRKLITILALFVFATLQIGVQVSFAEPKSSAEEMPSLQPQLVGRLTTRGNRPILVNGAGAATGASITTGATIETRADESATIDLGPLGRVDIAPNTKLILTFDERGEVRALVMFGCVILTANRNTKGELATEQGTIATTERETGGVLEMCFPPGAAAPTVGQGVAAGAGAGAGAPAGAAAAGGGGGLFGIGVPETIAIIAGGGAAALTPLFFQNNPSP